MEQAGLINGYDCDDCGEVTWTFTEDEGVTPMFIACRVTPDCRGRSVSRMYRNIPAGIKPGFTWYKPTRQAIAGSRREVQEHCRRGGLLLRIIRPEVAK